MVTSSIYGMRPWFAEYPPWVPRDLAPTYRTALEMLAASLARVPDGPAVHYREQSLSFAHIDHDSSALAAALTARGIARGDRVAIYLQNMPEFTVATLAAWKAGAIAVPINPMLRQQELRSLLIDSGAGVLIALRDAYPSVIELALAGTSVQTVVAVDPGPDRRGRPDNGGDAKLIDLKRLLLDHAGQRPPDPGLAPDDVAFLTYTSGTTGKPKGAMNTHENVAFNAEVYRVWMQLGSEDVILGAAPLFHITGLISAMATGLLLGIPVVLFFRFEPGVALEMIARWRCTTTVASITTFLSMMNHPDINRSDLRSFRKVYSGGAPVAPATVERFHELTGVRIHNIYGLTETTSPSHATPLGGSGPVDPESGALSVGLPVPSTDVKVIDLLDSRREVAPGEIGELWIKGPGVVPGYWQNPQATAETFTDGYLHTGDVGKMDSNGWFFIVDRAKDMINASGYKVWPREVEDFLYQHPAVREASVVGVPDPYRGENVKAFVALNPGSTTTPEELIAFCRERMAAYKYPRTVEIVDEIPKSATGKFLRRELREREAQRTKQR